MIHGMAIIIIPIINDFVSSEPENISIKENKTQGAVAANAFSNQDGRLKAVYL